MIGLGLLIYRRVTQGPVRLATARSDVVMYVVLVLALLVGLYCTLLGTGPHGGVYHYRHTVGVWFRGIWILQPRGDLMVGAPLDYQLHAVIGMALFCLWPFTRLVHAFSAPIAYLFRPYIVYRSREVAANNELLGSQPRRRAGERGVPEHVSAGPPCVAQRCGSTPAVTARHTGRVAPLLRRAAGARRVRQT